MSTTEQRLTNLIGYLSENQQKALLALMNSFLPDDVATEEDIRDIQQARFAVSRGEGITLESLIEEFGLTEEDLMAKRMDALQGE
jgi:hypothetical protein